MEQFKVGDKVRPICEPSRVETITEITNDGWVTVTNHRQVGYEYWLSSKIELAPIPKKADDMFAELGWTKGVSNDGFDCYYKSSYKDMTLDYILEEQQGGMVIFFYQDGDYEFVSYDRHIDCIVSPKLHKAIHKKLKELGLL